jgi:hypothetical protein
MRTRTLAKACGREAVTPAKRAREVRRLAIADEPCNVAHGDRRLLGQQARRGGHAPRPQVLLKADLAELRIGPLHLTRRARHRRGDGGERQPPTIVARHDHAREQVQPAAAGDRLRVHTTGSDRTARTGRRDGAGRRRDQAPRRSGVAARDPFG